MQPNFKPAKGSGARERFTRKEQRRVARDRQKRAEKREANQRERDIRHRTWLRDHGRCRAYGVPLFWISDDRPHLAHCHHMVYRSAGGSDEMFNRITLSPLAHEQEHEHLLKIEGEPNGTLYFTLKDRKGRIVRAWESAC